MALTTGNPILASEIISIKARVKAEMLRRDKIGSLAEYGGSGYDYTVTPAAGNPILPEHFNKIIVPMNAMQDTGLTEVASGDPIPALGHLNDLLTAAEQYPLVSSETNCKASCTGLCTGSCSTSCGKNCSSGCQGSCDADCADDCYTGCTKGCGKACSSGCTGFCDDSCGLGCANSCNGNCSSGCYTGCRGSCESASGSAG